MAEPGGEGTPGVPSGVTPGGSAHAALIQKGKEKEKELLDRLKEFFVEKGQPLEEGWRVEVKIRGSGTSLGTTDAYYFSPAGKRYRSRMEIARDLGVVDEKEARGGGKGRGKKADTAAPPPPLSREEAIAEARKRREAFKVPHKLAGGVTVTNLGGLYPGNPAYCNAERLWPAGYTAEWEDEKGVRFINSITETPSGPMFRIKAQRLASEERPATGIMELGAGPTPDAAYKDAEERQAEALEIALLNRSIRHRSDDVAGSPAVPAGRALDAAEHLLVKCRPLSAQWGLERFGLADANVLQAIEGLPGADQVPGYTFMEQREGGWTAEARRLNAELAARGKKQVTVNTRRLSGEGATASAPRKRAPRPSKKEAEENAVKRVLDGIIKQVEMEEMKACTAEQKLLMKLEKQLERERKRDEKGKMSEAMQKLREQQRLQQKAAYIEAQRRQAELNATVEDTELPNADEPPPEPSHVATGRLPAHQQAVLLETWQFVSRFGVPLLKLVEGERLPTLPQLEAALLGEAQPPLAPQASAADLPISPTAAAAAAAAGEATEGAQPAAPPPPDAATQLQITLVDFLVGGLFQETAQAVIGANSDITMADLRGPGKHATHPLTINQATWQEVARRYLTVLATSAMTQAKDGGHSAASSPSAVMDPWVILQYLTAGPPGTLTQGAAVLPRGACKTAAHSVSARADGAALAAAQQAFAAASCGAGAGGRSDEEEKDVQRLLRCVLREVIRASKTKKWDARVLSYGGQSAAAAAKNGRPLDFKCIAARVDAGVYTSLPDPLAALAADIRHMASLFQMACNKPHSLFAQEYGDKQAAELSALAVTKLEAALREIELTGPAEFIAQHARLPQGRRQAQATPESAQRPGAEEGTPGATPGVEEGREESAEPSQAMPEDSRAALAQRQVTDSVRDLDRPFAPFSQQGAWQGCVVCWSDDDFARLMPCDTCDCRTHSYCLDPPLEELPLQTEPFLCPRCIKLQGPGAQSGGKPLSVEFARASHGSAAWRLAQLLATSDYSEWSVQDRCALLHMLCTLCAESAQLHDTLHGEEDEVKDKRKEINSLKAEVKRIQAEITASQQQQQQTAAPPAAGQGNASAPAASPAAALPPLPQRQSRRGGRDPAAEIESMVERISKLEHDITQVGPVRLEPVGLDRHYNRYWLLPAAAVAADASLVLPDMPPVLVVEKHRLDSVHPASVEAAAAAVAAASDGEAAGWHVGLYNSILHLQQLAQYLNPKGSREKPLLEHVTRLLDQHQQFAMLHARLPRLPETDPLPPPDPAARRVAEVAALQQAMLSFEEGNQPATYDELAGSEERRQRWRAMVAAADTPQTLMAALVVLEGMVRPEYLKPHWRPFSMPAPHPQHISALPAVWLRLEALKANVKLKVTINIRALGGVGGAFGSTGTRYSLREPKPLLKRSYYEGPSSHPGSRAGSDSEDEDMKETRAERAAKRAKQREAAGVEDDEAVARELDAELNAGARRMRARQSAGIYVQRATGHGEEEGDWEEDEQEDSPADEDADMDDADLSD